MITYPAYYNPGDRGVCITNHMKSARVAFKPAVNMNLTAVKLYLTGGQLLTYNSNASGVDDGGGSCPTVTHTETVANNIYIPLSGTEFAVLLGDNFGNNLVDEDSIINNFNTSDTPVNTISPWSGLGGFNCFIDGTLQVNSTTTTLNVNANIAGIIIPLDPPGFTKNNQQDIFIHSVQETLTVDGVTTVGSWQTYNNSEPVWPMSTYEKINTTLVRPCQTPVTTVTDSTTDIVVKVRFLRNRKLYQATMPYLKHETLTSSDVYTVSNCGGACCPDIDRDYTTTAITILRPAPLINPTAMFLQGQGWISAAFGWYPSDAVEITI